MVFETVCPVGDKMQHHKTREIQTAVLEIVKKISSKL